MSERGLYILILCEKMWEIEININDVEGFTFRHMIAVLEDAMFETGVTLEPVYTPQEFKIRKNALYRFDPLQVDDMYDKMRRIVDNIGRYYDVKCVSEEE